MADQVYTLTMSYVSAGQFCQNIVGWRFDDAGFGSTFAAAEALCNAFNSSRKSLLMGCLPRVVTLTSLKARRYSTGGGLEAVVPMTTGNVGTRTGGISVSGASPCVIGYPTLPTTRRRARIFLPGVRELDLVNGTFTNTYKTAVNGAFGTLFDPLTLSGGGDPVATFVLKFSTPGTAVVISQWQLSDACGQLRRRQVPV
jgi:hypothetical protein